MWTGKECQAGMRWYSFPRYRPDAPAAAFVSAAFGSPVAHFDSSVRAVAEFIQSSA